MADIPNTLDNTYYQKQNHIRLPKQDVTKSNVLDAAQDTAAAAGVTIALGGRIGASVSIGSGFAITGGTLTATVSGLVGGETVTYQWTDDGGNISGATAATYAATIGTDSVADASLMRCVATVDGTPYTSNSRVLAYAAGTAPAIANGQAFVVGTAVNIDASASGANLTFTYALTGAPAGLSINASTGAITGDPTTVQTGTVTVTPTDQYGRTYPDTFTYGVTAAAAEIVLYAYANSLLNHDVGAGNSDTDSQNWLERMNTTLYRGGFQFTYGYNGSTPTNAQAPEDATPALSFTGWSGTEDVTDLVLGHDNFGFTGQTPDQASAVLGGGQSYVGLGSTTITQWEANAGPPARYWVFTGQRDAGPHFDPATATSGQIASWMASARGTYATNADLYVSGLQSAFPALDIRHMDCNLPFLDLIENGPAAIQALTMATWFEDDAPHGFSDYYLVQAIIMHIYLYDEEPAVYTPAGGTGIDSAITSNWAAITSHLYDFINPPLAAPVITGVPTISGTETEGETLTATAASVTGNPTPTRTWQWERTGVAISGATSVTYTLVTADVGETITVVQTETNSESPADTAESAATAAIAAIGGGGDTISFTGGAGSQYINGLGITGDTFNVEAEIILQNFTDQTGMLGAESGGTNFAVAFQPGNNRFFILGNAPGSGVGFTASNSFSSFGWAAGEAVTMRATCNAGAMTVSLTDGANTSSLSVTFTDITAIVANLRIMADFDGSGIEADMDSLTVAQTSATGGDTFTGTAAEWNAGNGSAPQFTMVGTVTAA